MSIKSGRTAGLLATEIDAGRMTLRQAEWRAQMDTEFGLDGDEIDDVIERLRRNCEPPEEG